MRTSCLLIVLMVLISSVNAQTVKYTAFVYTDEGLANQIQTYSGQVRGGSTRGAFGDLLLEASLNAAKGIGAGYVTSVVNLGVQSIASLITRNQRMKQEWEQTVNAENTFCTQIHTISGLKDFYSKTSFASPMDPTGMKFNGIGVVRKDGKDTLFYISLHIDRSKINRIVEHSKFELVLDTLIVSPTHSNLPNSKYDTVFRWVDRQNYAMNLHLVITSSWMNEITQIFRDEQLGEFTINIPVKKKNWIQTVFFVMCAMATTSRDIKLSATALLFRVLIPVIWMPRVKHTPFGALENIRYPLTSKKHAV